MRMSQGGLSRNGGALSRAGMMSLETSNYNPSMANLGASTGRNFASSSYVNPANSNAFSNNSRRERLTQRKRKASSSDESDSSGEGGAGSNKMMEMMALAQMMKAQPDEDDELTKMIQNVKGTNDAILALKQSARLGGSPFGNQVRDKVQYLEKLVLESDKKNKNMNEGYFFNQMLMMMMMNPSRPL